MSIIFQIIWKDFIQPGQKATMWHIVLCLQFPISLQKAIIIPRNVVVKRIKINSNLYLIIFSTYYNGHFVSFFILWFIKSNIHILIYYTNPYLNTRQDVTFTLSVNKIAKLPFCHVFAVAFYLYSSVQTANN